jgi:hypothetical protein
MYGYRKSRSTTNRNLEQKVVNLKDKIAKEKAKSLVRDLKLSC